ncbi:hypothetical protein Pmani_028087 [Petrolisthes manimaculis]|uniref:Uncharacterized protein n=1 Tax=Petrolisthes manimaculis TaxID=1843537 RepID=A0AAE1P2Z2_9EUCA|nr:hypothetical protein Pmani_028087 [Petrolisthes manimaculis]
MTSRFLLALRAPIGQRHVATTQGHVCLMMECWMKEIAEGEALPNCIWRGIKEVEYGSAAYMVENYLISSQPTTASH